MEGPAWPEDPRELGDERLRVGDVLEAVLQDRRVDRAGRQREILQIADVDVEVVAPGRLCCCRVALDADDAAAPRPEVEQEVAVAAADIDDAADARTPRGDADVEAAAGDPTEERLRADRSAEPDASRDVAQDIPHSLLHRRASPAHVRVVRRTVVRLDGLLVGPRVEPPKATAPTTDNSRPPTRRPGGRNLEQRVGGSVPADARRLLPHSHAWTVPYPLSTPAPRAIVARVRDRRALVVITDLPAPPRSGNHLRDLQTLRVLNELGFDVGVVAADHAPTAARELGTEARLLARVSVAREQATPRARLRRMLRLARAASRSSEPGPWSFPYVDAGIDKAVAHALDEHAPDVVILRSTLAHLAREIRPRVETLVLDAHDAESFLARTLLRLSPWTHRPVALLRLKAAVKAEALSAIADEVWVPTEREAAHMRPRAGNAAVLVVPNGVEVRPTLPARSPEDVLLFVAGFGYPPNVAAATRLVEEILPRVRRTHPNVQVELVGRDLPGDAASRWARNGVTWHGVVDDLAPLYRRAAAFVLAYDASTEAGTPLKVAEAVANGVPVVATPNATEPIGLEHETHVLTAVDSAELAAHVVHILDGADDAAARASRAHAWAAENLAPAAIARRLRERSRLCATPSARAAANRAPSTR